MNVLYNSADNTMQVQGEAIIRNNLIMYAQSKSMNSLETIVPDLASKWEWKDAHPTGPWRTCA